MNNDRFDNGLSVKETPLPNGKVDLTITCDTSGKPLTRSTKFGMFCDDPNCECEQRSIESAPKMDKIFSFLEDLDNGDMTIDDFVREAKEFGND